MASWMFAPLTVALLACAGQQPSRMNGPSSRQEDEMSNEDAADRLWDALRRANVREATTDFAPALRDKLTPDRLGALWGNVTRSLGALRSWSHSAERVDGGQRVREYRLSFERGRLRGVIALDPGSGEVTGLHLRPLPPAEGEGP